jgi:hypothetical protein
MVVDNPPTDYELVRAIYNHYYEEFVCFDSDKRSTRNYVPIDLHKMARLFDCSPHLIFAVLYDSLDARYGVHTGKGRPFVGERGLFDDERDENEVIKPLFMNYWPNDIRRAMPPKFRDEKSLVNFAMLAGIYATMRAERSEFHWRTWLSIFAIVISAIALLVKAS